MISSPGRPAGFRRPMREHTASAGIFLSRTIVEELKDGY